MDAIRRRAIGLVLLAGIGLLGVSYWETFESIVRKWIDDAAFSHGWLIVPIASWLAWRRRALLAAAQLRPSWLGVALLIGCAATWIVARGAGVVVIEQFAAVAMVPALVAAIAGWHAARILAFPLAFLFFAVPFGRGIVPVLMQVTAQIATSALRWTGVPIVSSHMFISIPAGEFEVARTCSGLNYFVTALVLGVLYAYTTYRTWHRRLLCVAAFVVIPVVANGLRVYFTILAAHLTDMRFGPGVEHVTFGRIFFLAVMLAMFWIGQRWRETGPDDIAPTARARAVTPGAPIVWLAMPAAFMVLWLAPAYLEASVSMARARLVDAGLLIALPPAAGGWTGPTDGTPGWRPQYQGAIAERQGFYSDGGTAPVKVFVALYGLGNTLGAEMISYDNRLSYDEATSLGRAAQRAVSLPDGRQLQVVEQVVNLSESRQLVWHWFRVGERPATNAFVVKALEAAAFVTRGADSERIIVLSTPLDDEAAARLQSFVAAHADCVAAGLALEACGA